MRVCVNKDEAEDQRVGRTTSGQTDTNWLTSGFARYEHQLDTVHRAYAGLGHSQRAADYWGAHTQSTNNGMMAAAWAVPLTSHLKK